MKNKNIYIIAGCNGAGKTSASFTILPEIIECREFVNADEIAKGISPFQPEKVAVEAGRIMLKRVNELLASNESFAFETTLSSRTYKSKIEEAKKQGYTATLIFLWLKSIDLAKQRVETRVADGGHNIKPDVIERSYIRGIKNLFDIYMPVVHGAFIFDNSLGIPEIIAQKTLEFELEVIDASKYAQLRETYDNN
jgi:predicted ABC-type ATPase